MSIDAQLLGALQVSSGAHDDPGPSGSHNAFQTSTLAALLDGAYEGDVTIGELQSHGDFGIGTLNGCDGELVAIDGQYMRADASGSITHPSQGDRTPFAVVTRFDPKHSIRLALGEDEDFDQLCTAIDADAGDPSIVHAVRIDGRFRSVRCRSVPKQSSPYRPLAAVLGEQSVFELSGPGTIVGFRFPNFGMGLGVPGYHLHFVTEDRRRGGHVLDVRCDGSPLRVAIDDLSSLHVEAPPGVEVGAHRIDPQKIDSLEREHGGTQ